MKEPQDLIMFFHSCSS